jgi:hypothetical protein
MSYPNIFPVDLGRDGWALHYTDPVSRLLFLCGLRFNGSTWRVQRF